MNRVVLWGYNPGVLQHKLNRGVVGQPVDLGPIGGLQVLRPSAGEVEGVRWISWKVGGVNPADVEVMGLEERRGGHDERDVVHAGHDPAPVAGLARRARVDPQAHREIQVVVDLQRHLRRKLLGVQAPEGVDETVGHLCGVDERSLGEGGRRGGERAGVVDSGGGSYVVDGDRRVHERRCSHEVLAGFLVSGDEDVGGLAGGYENGVDLERLDIDGVDFDDGELVAGNLEEELFIERSVDYSQQVGLSTLNRQRIALCISVCACIF